MIDRSIPVTGSSEGGPFDPAQSGERSWPPVRASGHARRPAAWGTSPERAPCARCRCSPRCACCPPRPPPSRPRCSCCAPRAPRATPPPSPRRVSAATLNPRAALLCSATPSDCLTILVRAHFYDISASGSYNHKFLSSSSDKLKDLFVAYKSIRFSSSEDSCSGIRQEYIQIDYSILQRLLNFLYQEF